MADDGRGDAGTEDSGEPHSSWVVVAEYGAVFEADMAVEMLREAGIPALRRAESSGIFGQGYAGTVTGGARVMVPQDLADEAATLLETD